MDELAFHKMHGLGNDFVILDRRSGKLSLSAVQIGASPTVVSAWAAISWLSLEPSERADVFMRVYNPDGSAIRRLRQRLLRRPAGHGGAGGGRATIETEAGVLTVTAGARGYTVDMGRPRFGWDEIPLAGPADTLRSTWRSALQQPVAVNMGNPHAVFLVEDAEAVPLAELGTRARAPRHV